MTISGDDAIVNPVRGKNPPDVGSTAVMVSTISDLGLVCKRLNLDPANSRSLMMSRLYTGDGPCSAAGPVVGAPYAVMVLESLVAWGARRIIFHGWCGAVSPEVEIGDIIIPTGSMIDEGTSVHYGGSDKALAKPAAGIVKKTRDVLEKKGFPFHEGTIWTTDGIFRETRDKVEYYQGKNVLGVEMELSALFTAGKFRNVEVGGVLVVSDEISSFKWKTGFKTERFKQSRLNVVEVVHDLCRSMAGDDERNE